MPIYYPAKPTARRIRQAWDEAEAEFEDKSTEFLAAIVSDRLGIEYSDVFDALYETSRGANRESKPDF